MDDLLRRIGLMHNRATADAKSVLTRVLKTVIEMLCDRHHASVQSVTSYEALLCAIEEGRPVASSSEASVYFHNEERVGVKHMRTWADANPLVDIVIVSLEGPTSFTRREAEAQFPRVQFFTFRDLCVNITHHSLVPKHELCPTPIDYGPPRCLPIIFSNDRVVQYYNFKPGDVLRITRLLGTQQPVHYYRLVTTAPDAR